MSTRFIHTVRALVRNATRSALCRVITWITDEPVDELICDAARWAMQKAADDAAETVEIDPEEVVDRIAEDYRVSDSDVVEAIAGNYEVDEDAVAEKVCYDMDFDQIAARVADTIDGDDIAERVKESIREDIEDDLRNEIKNELVTGLLEDGHFIEQVALTMLSEAQGRQAEVCKAFAAALLKEIERQIASKSEVA